ncbi:MAG: transposase [Candidatus Paceibacterota bacterium]|jgi:hypothetical protein
MRIIGIRHRVKKTAEGEARPTQVTILENGKTTTLDLETETDELNFVLGIFPAKTGKTETLEGLQSDDKIAMILGGSGDNLAFALARRGQEIGATVHRIPPAVFKTVREKAGDKDAEFLAMELEKSPATFYQVGPRDLSLIWIRECLRSRVDAMKARIACEQRLRQHMIGAVFCSPEGKFPEGGIEKKFDDLKANDQIFKAVVAEEGKRERELIKACEGLDVYTELFKPVVGLGPMIASRIIGAVIDIRRFETKAKLRAFCGVHLLGDGRFPRRRNNEVANWSKDCRQALYLLGDQFNRRPDSVWGKKLLEAKVKYRASHPYPVLVTNDQGNFELHEGFFKKNSNGTYNVIGRGGSHEGLKGTIRYTNGHIHKMATWYTLGKFVELLFRDWWKLEGATGKSESGDKIEA